MLHLQELDREPYNLDSQCHAQSTQTLTEGMVIRQSNRHLGLSFLWAQGTEKVFLGPRFCGKEAWEPNLILV